jgi:hypothetical protein
MWKRFIGDFDKNQQVKDVKGSENVFRLRKGSVMCNVSVRRS